VLSEKEQWPKSDTGRKRKCTFWPKRGPPVPTNYIVPTYKYCCIDVHVIHPPLSTTHQSTLPAYVSLLMSLFLICTDGVQRPIYCCGMHLYTGRQDGVLDVPLTNVSSINNSLLYYVPTYNRHK